ncbi:MAG TPA: hypothetical protein VE954_12065 [Oligoflexus sp.]|uniref:hypothetical protein n=1 Tax=Oligoflexus sp. TaxID=1971216 RepID=UPI002D2C7EE3|nr:hypothetical protein [Oligoflexus sp.]HYX33841.1 hypothetical protein [Oligoflexus sp.]
MFLKKSFWKVSIAVLALGVPSANLWAKGSNELLYTEPFDLAAGGTSLTRASQEGIVFANPALLPLGGAWIRWLGFQAGFMLDRGLAQSAQGGDIGSAAGTGDSDFVDELFSKSLHFGQTATLSFLNQNFAVSVFDRVEVDVAGERFGDSGLPSVNFGVEAYGGILTSYALRPVRWFSLGLTAKHLYASEPQIKVPLTDQEKIRQLSSNTDELKDEIALNQGTGSDLGMLFLWQGHHVDLSMGLKVEDVGGTRFTGDQKAFPQTYNAGFGLAVHGTKEVLHLSLDYRDIGNAYEEKTFKKVYLGARFMLRNMFGIACGLYQGIPTAGVRMDLVLFKLGLTAYGRELGTYPGDKQRNMVMLYTSFGF